MSLRVRLDKERAAIELRHAPPEIKKRIRSGLHRLIDDPLGRNRKVNVRRLHHDGPEVFYRLRVGDWRVIYSFDATHLYVLRVLHREEGYEWMDRLEDEWRVGHPAPETEPKNKEQGEEGREGSGEPSEPY